MRVSPFLTLFLQIILNFRQNKMKKIILSSFSMYKVAEEDLEACEVVAKNHVSIDLIGINIFEYYQQNLKSFRMLPYL